MTTQIESHATGDEPQGDPRSLDETGDTGVDGSGDEVPAPGRRKKLRVLKVRPLGRGAVAPEGP